MSIAIEIENIGKRYLLGEVGVKTLQDELSRFWANARGREWNYAKVDNLHTRAEKDHIWAVRNLDLQIEQGDIVGIIGENGAGKSTLLKLMSRITSPTEGTIKAKGRIASLLEVGTGFHSELTGRENIFLNGAIMGMRKSEINSRLEEIVEFSGCERYIDTPVKRYSSGMIVRLGFAVAAHLECEILIVDEVLAVGDSEFRRKSTDKLKALSTSEGRTILFVSHNMSTVKNLCKSGAVIREGRAIQFEQIKDAVAEYTHASEKGILEYSFPKISNKPHITGVRLIQSELEQGSLKVVIGFEAHTKFRPSCGVIVFNEELYPVAASNMKIHPPKAAVPEVERGELICTIDTPPLRSGVYTLSAWLGDKTRDYDVKEHIIKFSLDKNDEYSNLSVREYGSYALTGHWVVDHSRFN